MIEMSKVKNRWSKKFQDLTRKYDTSKKEGLKKVFEEFYEYCKREDNELHEAMVHNKKWVNK